MNRKEELEVLIENTTKKLVISRNTEKNSRQIQKDRVIAFFSEFLGLPSEQLSNTNITDYSTVVAVKLTGEDDFDSAELTIYHPGFSRKVFGLGWFSSGAGMDSVSGERNLLYLEVTGSIAKDLRTGNKVIDFLTDEIEIERENGRTSKDLSIKLTDLKAELSNIIDEENLNEGLEMGKIQFDEQGFYASGLEEKISKLTIEKVTDKTITFKYTKTNYSYSETKRLKIGEGNRLIIDAVKFLKDLKAEKESV